MRKGSGFVKGMKQIII